MEGEVGDQVGWGVAGMSGGHLNKEGDVWWCGKGDLGGQLMWSAIVSWRQEAENHHDCSQLEEALRRRMKADEIVWQTLYGSG